MEGTGESRRILIHRPEDFAGMRAAGLLAAESLDMIAAHVTPGITTDELDQVVGSTMAAARPHRMTPSATRVISRRRASITRIRSASWKAGGGGGGMYPGGAKPCGGGT